MQLRLPVHTLRILKIVTKSEMHGRGNTQALLQQCIYTAIYQRMPAGQAGRIIVVLQAFLDVLLFKSLSHVFLLRGHHTDTPARMRRRDCKHIWPVFPDAFHANNRLISCLLAHMLLPTCQDAAA